jgi:hypothetical protein
MNERKISLGPTTAQQDRAHARLIKRRASSERGAGPQGMVRGPYDPSETARVYTDGPESPTPSELSQAELEPLPTGNTLCPKIGAEQWTCTKDECTCHLKESIGVIKVGPIR